MIDRENKHKIHIPIIKSSLFCIVIVLIILIVYFGIFGLLYSFSAAFKNIIGFLTEERIECIIGFIIGMIGVYFGVRAMQEASTAVKNSDKIIHTISSFFNDFSSMMPEVCNLINSAQEELQIMVSLPAYGYLLNEPLGELFFNSLNKKITDATKGKPQIEFICFRQDRCDAFEDTEKLFQEEVFKSLSPAEQKVRIQTYFSHKRLILNGLFDILNNNKLLHIDCCNLYTLMQDPYIRIFIADNKEAIFAITPNFAPSNFSDFVISGYKTKDKKMVGIIKNLFDRYKSGNAISTAEFNTFSFGSNEN